jgi:hypothetical protein
MDELLEEIEAFLQAQPKQVDFIASSDKFTIFKAGRYILVEDENFEVVEYIPLNQNN